MSDSVASTPEDCQIRPFWGETCLRGAQFGQQDHSIHGARQRRIRAAHGFRCCFLNPQIHREQRGYAQLSPATFEPKQEHLSYLRSRDRSVPDCLRGFPPNNDLLFRNTGRVPCVLLECFLLNGRGRHRLMRASSSQSFGSDGAFPGGMSDGGSSLSDCQAPL